MFGVLSAFTNDLGVLKEQLIVIFIEVHKAKRKLDKGKVMVALVGATFYKWCYLV